MPEDNLYNRLHSANVQKLSRSLFKKERRKKKKKSKQKKSPHETESVLSDQIHLMTPESVRMLTMQGNKITNNSKNCDKIIRKRKKIPIKIYCCQT